MYLVYSEWSCVILFEYGDSGMLTLGSGQLLGTIVSDIDCIAVNVWPQYILEHW